MVMPQRVEYEGAYYHVMNRGQGRQNVYHGKRYYEYFLDCLEQAHKRFALEVHVDIRGQVSFVEIKLQDWANLIMNFTKLT